MNDLEDRIRVELAAWAQEAPTPRGWSPRGPIHELAPAARPALPRRWLAVAAAAVLLVVGAAIAMVTRDEAGEPTATGPDVVRAELPVGEELGVRVLAVDDSTGALFVASENDARLYRIDPETEAVTEGPALWARDVVGAAGGSVYVVLDDPVRIARLDGETFDELASVEIAGAPTSAKPIAGRLWVRTSERGLVTMDLTTLEARPEVPFDHGPGFLAEGPAGVWLTDLDAGEVARVDPETGETLATIELDGARGIAVGDDEVWVTVDASDRVVRIDPDDGSIASVADSIGRRPHGVAVDGDRIWVTTFGDGRLLGFDAGSLELVTSLPVGLRPGAVVVAGDSVWVSVHQRAAVLQLDRERLRTTGVTTPAWTDTSVPLGDGADLLLRCMGAGDATVLLMPRDGADLGEWAYVQPRIARSTRVCAYEPPDDAEHAPTNVPDAQLAVALRTALREAGNEGPFVVVGSQGGSLRASAFAEAHADEVLGLVLVDAGPLVDTVREATAMPLVTVEDGVATAGGVPSAPQREPARVVGAIFELLERR
jgi:DNA-binding beta-propeller fold protein YncE